MKGGNALGSAAAAEQSRQSRGGTLGPHRSHAARVRGSNGSTRVAVVLWCWCGFLGLCANARAGPEDPSLCKVWVQMDLMVWVLMWNVFG